MTFQNFPNDQKADETVTTSISNGAVEVVAGLPVVIDARTALVARVADSGGVIGDFDDLDLDPDAASGVLPVLAMNRKVGQSDSGILVDNVRHLELEFIWAARATTRAHFPAPYGADPDARPDCFSVDGKTPSPTVTAPKAPSCVGCPWSFEATGIDKGPDGSPGCSKNLEALVYVNEGDMSRVARIRFSGLANKAARDYWDSFRFARPKKYAFQFLTRMRLVAESTKNGDFLVPVFERVDQLADEHALRVGHDARALTATFTEVIVDDIVTAAVREAPDTGPGPFDDDPAEDLAAVVAPLVVDTPLGGVDVATGEIVTITPPAAAPAAGSFGDVGAPGWEAPF